MSWYSLRKGIRREGTPLPACVLPAARLEASASKKQGGAPLPDVKAHSDKCSPRRALCPNPSFPEAKRSDFTFSSFTTNRPSKDALQIFAHRPTNACATTYICILSDSCVLHRGALRPAKTGQAVYVQICHSSQRQANAPGMPDSHNTLKNTNNISYISAHN